MNNDAQTTPGAACEEQLGPNGDWRPFIFLCSNRAKYVMCSPAGETHKTCGTHRLVLMRKGWVEQ